MLALKEDVERVQDQLLENVDRKQKLANKIQTTTDSFRDEAADLRQELNRVNSKLKEVYEHKERMEDQALFLLDDRGSYGLPR